MSNVCTWPSCKCTAKYQCEGLGPRILAPTFTAADLERAWEMCREEAEKAILPEGSITWSGSWYEPALRAAQARVRALNPPADLAQRVKE